MEFFFEVDDYVVLFTIDEVGAPMRLSGGPSAATNISVVHLMAIQSTFDLELEEPQAKIGRVTATTLIQKLSKLAQ